MNDERGLTEALLGDGRFLVGLTGFCLALSGAFAVMQSVSGHLLPHDSQAIGMDAAGLVHAGNQRLLGFMFHDRVAYGGALLSIGFGYLWLAGFPLAARKAWAWWALVVSGAIGFLAFLTYLGQGYLDTWHGVATLFLMPVFVASVWRCRPSDVSRRRLQGELPNDEEWTTRWGRGLLGATAMGLILAGATIAIFGMTTVFVPSDLRFIGIDEGSLRRISPMLVPVIAHDRAGFGGGLCSIGCFLLFVARFGEITRSLVQIVAVMGCAGFGCAIGVHFAVGYLDVPHLLPAFVGLALFLASDALLWMGRVNNLKRPAQVGNTAAAA